MSVSNKRWLALKCQDVRGVAIAAGSGATEMTVLALLGAPHLPVPPTSAVIVTIITPFGHLASCGADFSKAHTPLALLSLLTRRVWIRSVHALLDVHLLRKLMRRNNRDRWIEVPALITKWATIGIRSSYSSYCFILRRPQSAWPINNISSYNYFLAEAIRKQF